jgi:hypothetical protein
MSTDFEVTESGLYAPKPKGVRAVQLTGVGLSQMIVANDLDMLSDDIDNHLDGTYNKWMEFTDPVFGEPLKIHRRFLESLQGIGYTWVDHEEVRLSQREREAAKRNARKVLR